MKIYVVSNYSKTHETYRSSWPYRAFFEGDSCPWVNSYGQKPYRSLLLTRNVRLMPPVAIVSISLVVERTISQHLKEFKHVDSQPCVWENQYDWPIDPASISKLETQFNVFDEGFSQWLSTIQKPATSAQLPRYDDIIVPQHANLVKRFTATTEFLVPSPPYEKLPPIRTCAKLHELYPISKLVPYFIFSEEAYPVIAPHISDSELFTVLPFDVL